MGNPVRLMMIAFGLLVTGAALPFLMVIGVLTSTLPLNFAAYACSVTGFIMGIVGITQQRRPPKQ